MLQFHLSICFYVKQFAYLEREVVDDELTVVPTKILFAALLAASVLVLAEYAEWIGTSGTGLDFWLL